MLSSYPYEEIGDGIYEINEYDGVSMFLLVGRKRALLIDTGVGIGDLKSFVSTLVNKPVDVFITHNHRDHAGNAPLFPTVYMSRIDKAIGAMVRDWTTKESRMKYARRTAEHYPDRIYPWTEDDIQEFTSAQEPEVIGVDDGYTFDLGGRTATCLLCQGHTPGSMVVIDSKTGYLFSGDCCNDNLGIGVRKLENECMRHSSVEEALAGLERIWELDFDRNKVFSAHSDFRNVGEALKPYIMPRIIAGMHKILEGDYVVHKEWIQVIDTIVEQALFEDVTIQFHSDKIYKPYGNKF